MAQPWMLGGSGTSIAVAASLLMALSGCGGEPPTKATAESSPSPVAVSLTDACPKVITDVTSLANYLQKITRAKGIEAGTDTESEDFAARFGAHAATVDEPLNGQLESLNEALRTLSEALSAEKAQTIEVTPVSSAAGVVIDTCAPFDVSDSDGDGVIDAEDSYPSNPDAFQTISIDVDCDVKGGYETFTIDRINPDWESIWKAAQPAKNSLTSPSVYCEALEPPTEPVSAVEQRIWDRYKSPDEYTISVPYEQCVEHGTSWTRNKWPVSPEQVKEAQDSLILCPDHPDAAAIRTRIKEQGGVLEARKEGRAFFDGNYRVGERVRPGTYFTTDVEGCYWERLDARGEIIDNNFVSSALRVEATIKSSDYSFHSEGCGEWRQGGS